MVCLFIIRIVIFIIIFIFVSEGVVLFRRDQGFKVFIDLGN